MRTILFIAVLSVFSLIIAGPSIWDNEGGVITVSEFCGDSVVNNSHFTIMTNENTPLVCTLDPFSRIKFYPKKTFGLLKIPKVSVKLSGYYYGLENTFCVKKIYFPDYNITIPPEEVSSK